MLQLYWTVAALIDFFIIYKFNIVTSVVDIVWAILLHILILALLCGLHLLFLIAYSFTVKRNEEVKNIHNSYRFLLLYSLKLYFQLARVKIRVSGLEKVPDDGKFLFVGNHISSYDPMIAMWTLRKNNLAFVSKKENLDIKFGGKYILKSGCVGLDRENNREAVKAINKAAQNITDGVCAMGIYPEGWVNKTGEGLLPFRNGSFKIAKKAKVPIVVATIANTRQIDKNRFFRRTEIRFRIVEIIPYEKIADMKTNEIGEMVHEIMYNALEKK
ncbi:MAG: 1-acyl-sn-glycerol-3-phosphate acyltransferase [Clostridia bacterium]|nr:1-acyl-sn-glycerol-3-phosphate acyltransferase [Clostridia bacterium]